MSLRIEKLSGAEGINYFQIESNILDFWQWSYSDLKNPTIRGDFAEYLVYMALKDGLSREHYNTRMDWDVVDFVYGYGIDARDQASYFCDSTGFGWCIEVKSASESNKKIKFKTEGKQGYHFKSKTIVNHVRKWSDIFVLCLLKDDKAYSKDILDFDNWDFYIIPSHQIESKNSIKLEYLKTQNIQPRKFHEIKFHIDQLVSNKKEYAALKSWKEQHDAIKKNCLKKPCITKIEDALRKIIEASSCTAP